MNLRRSFNSVVVVAHVLVLAALFASLAACGQREFANPSSLLLAPEDFPGIAVSVLTTSEEQSLDGPSALVELQGPDFQVLQSIVLFDTREHALTALDSIRADLVSRGETGPGGVEASGIFEHSLGTEDAVSLFFIEGNGLVRLTVTGPGREKRLAELADVAREKLGGS